MAQHSVLIVDDEPDILQLISMTFMQMGLATSTAPNLAEAKAQLARKAFNFCLTDLRLPDGDGIELVSFIQLRYPEMPVAVITAHGNVETATEAMKAGAFDFVSKPVDINMLRSLTANALSLEEDSDSDTAVALPDFIGESAQIEKLRSTIGKVSRSQAPVHIYGESGTGKELVAQLIHLSGSRKSQPFIPVNCGAIPSELMESELFGHKKGSFTGAVSDKDGLFMAARGGTLFLDEIADLPLSMQVKLLRTIQEKKIRQVGSEEEVSIDVRILSATHKNLVALVEAGEFRQDLYYRINVIGITVPSLKKRRDDVPLLCDFFLERLASDPSQPLTMTDEAKQALAQYDFPGNIRELENIIERAYALSGGETIDVHDLHLPDQQATVTQQAPEPASAPASLRRGDQPLEEFLEEIEKEEIIAALEEARWNKTEAAKKLGMSFRAIRYRLKKLGLEE